MGRFGPLLLLAAAQVAGQEPYAAGRAGMVRDDIAGRGIRDEAVLRAMRETPRHLFTPERYQAQAYADHPLPIGYGQTISQPYIVAYMSERLEVRPEHRVLEIGTGSGYQAAILGQLAGEVYTIEIVPELARGAAETLRRLGYRNVDVREGDGYQGWPEKGPFDRIMLTACPPELPQALVDQLKPGGRLIGPVGATVMSQNIVIVDKDAAGATTVRTVLPVRFVPMVKPGVQ